MKFDWHKCYAYKSGIVKGNYFIVAARCKNRICTNFKFICEFPIHEPFSDVKLKVFRGGEISHDKDDVNRRFVRQKRRLELGKEMQRVSPSVMNLKMLNNVPEDILDQGNVNNTPGLQILQKISVNVKKVC